MYRIYSIWCQIDPQLICQIWSSRFELTLNKMFEECHAETSGALDLIKLSRPRQLTTTALRPRRRSERGGACGVDDAVERNRTAICHDISTNDETTDQPNTHLTVPTSPTPSMSNGASFPFSSCPRSSFAAHSKGCAVVVTVPEVGYAYGAFRNVHAFVPVFSSCDVRHRKRFDRTPTKNLSDDCAHVRKMRDIGKCRETVASDHGVYFRLC